MENMTKANVSRSISKYKLPNAANLITYYKKNMEKENYQSLINGLDINTWNNQREQIKYIAKKFKMWTNGKVLIDVDTMSDDELTILVKDLANLKKRICARYEQNALVEVLLDKESKNLSEWELENYERWGFEYLEESGVESISCQFRASIWDIKVKGVINTGSDTYELEGCYSTVDSL
jgi:hypothetical protein